jgi:hypothetical protein
MSQTRLTCTSCRRQVPAQICRSNINGNAGRSFVSCENAQPDGSQCKYYRWLTPKSTPTSTPASSPVLPSLTPTLPAAPSSSTVLPMSLTSVSLPSPTTCARPDCSSTRINVRCVNKQCRKHCREIGGCTAKDHHGSGVSQGAVAASHPSYQLAATTPSPPPSPSRHDDSTMPSSSTIVAHPATNPAAPSSAVDPRPNPHYISHMRPIFTKHYATQQEITEKRRKAEAERLGAIEKAKHCVVAYSWIQNSEEPTVFTFQDGFTWPHFVVTLDVLRDLFFFFFFLYQQFITRCSNAVRGPIIQTVRTLRLRYALPVITQPNASGPPSGGQTQAAAHEYSNVTVPFRAVKKSRPPNMGLRTQ